MVNRDKLIYRYRFINSIYDFYKKIKKNVYLDSIPYRNNRDIYNPFFIVGSGRSGNTLLRRILQARKGIVIPPETYVLGKILRLHNVHRSLEWDDYVNLILSTYEYHPEFYTFELDSLAELALELKKIETDKRSLAFIINQFYEFYAQKNDFYFHRWGDKTPLNSLYVYRIKKIFPRAQFVHVIRDGIDVINSYVNAGIYSDYYSAAVRWNESNNLLKRFGQKYPEIYYVLKYEDLVAHPLKSVKSVCDFLDIDFSASMLTPNEVENLGDVKYHKHHQNVNKVITTESIGKGRRELSNKVLQRVSSLINDTLGEFGYKRV